MDDNLMDDMARKTALRLNVSPESVRAEFKKMGPQSTSNKDSVPDEKPNFVSAPLSNLNDTQKQRLLEDTMIGIRNSYIDERIKEIRHKVANPSTSHEEKLDLVRESDQLIAEKRSPLAVIREVPPKPNCVGCDDLKRIYVPGTGAPFDSWPCPKCCEPDFVAAVRAADAATNIPGYVLIKRFGQYLRDNDRPHYLKLNAE